MQGVYKITNTQNGKIYIGSSDDTRSRWINHQSKLRNNNHCNPHLQRSWNKYDSGSFEFEVVEEVIDSDDLIDREQHYIDTLNPEYNIRPKAGRSKLSEETKRKIGKAVGGENHPFYGKTGEDHPAYGSERSEEVRKVLSEQKQGEKNPMYDKTGEDNPFYGEKHTQETKEKLSKINTGKNHPMYGKSRSEKAKEAVSKANRGEKCSKAKLTEKKVKVIKHLLNGGHFTHNQIGRMYGVDRATISMINTGQTWSHVSIETEGD